MTVKVVFCLVLVAACERSVPQGARSGEQLFTELCSSCHGPKGKPNATMVARLGVRDLTAPEVRARLTPPLIEHQIRKGSQNKLMPAFEGALIDEHIKALAEYVASPTFLGPP